MLVGLNEGLKAKSRIVRLAMWLILKEPTAGLEPATY
jgi:hypothetical protein